MDNDRLVGLNINNITLVEAKELMQKVREIEQRNPKRSIFTMLTGLEDEPMEKAKEIIGKVFPKKKVSS